MMTYRFEVTLHLDGPLLSQAAGGSRLGLDVVALRGDAGVPALPGSLIKGNLRHAWVAINRLLETDRRLDVDHWLGRASSTQEYEPLRARLRFAEHWLVATGVDGAGRRHRIRIDPETGVVKPGHLMVIDSPYNAGDPIDLRGDIYVDLPRPDQAGELKRWIHKGLEYQSALGAFKGVGYGRLVGVDVQTAVVGGDAASSASVTGASRIGLRLELDRPFCIARPHTGNNRYASEDFIPGGVIRGAMARRIFAGDRSEKCADPRFDTLCRHFDHVLVTHAQCVPCNHDRRSLAPPLSLAAAAPTAGDRRGQRLYDLALLSGAGLIHERAPAFQPDWKGKEWRSAAKLCGNLLPERCLTVRTAIEQGTDVAMEAALFATESVVARGYQWLANLDIGAVNEADRATVANELALLLREPLFDIGKTKAVARVTLDSSPFADHVASSELLREGRALVCLRSQARLLPDPYALRGTGDQDELFKRYADVWRDVSAGSLELVRFFARQELAGGNYLYRHFWSSRGPYNPELLTSAGSVFVLHPVSGKESQARAALEQWRRIGLPQPQDAPGGNDWRRNPYIRGNGYGEVAVNLALHWDLSPGQEAWYGID